MAANSNSGVEAEIAPETSPPIAEHVGVKEQNPVKVDNLILGEEDWHIIATLETEKDVERDAQGRNEDSVKELKAYMDELEMLKDVLEATRAAFREELEASLRSKCKLAAVNEELEETKNFIHELGASRLEITATKGGLRAAKAELDAVKADFKGQLKVSKNQRVAAEEMLEGANNAFNIELEAARH
jgi:chromosome segregation ATPase